MYMLSLSRSLALSLSCTHPEIVSKPQLHDVKGVSLFLEHRLDGVLDCTSWWHCQDLCHLVGKVDLKDISLVSLEDVEMLYVCVQ